MESAWAMHGVCKSLRGEAWGRKVMAPERQKSWARGCWSLLRSRARKEEQLLLFAGFLKFHLPFRQHFVLHVKVHLFGRILRRPQHLLQFHHDFLDNHVQPFRNSIFILLTHLASNIIKSAEMMSSCMICVF